MNLYRRLFVSDLHAPFHDKAAFRLLLDIAYDFKPHEIVILGDFFDFYSVSRHEKDPRIDFKTWGDEMREAREVLHFIEKIPCKSRVYLSGNHENRLHRYINEYAPKLSGIYTLPELLGISEKWRFLEYGQGGYYKMGKLIACHGTRAGEHPAAAMVKKLRSSVIFGHVHKLQEYHISNIHGHDFVGLAAGWLGDQRKAAEYIKDVADWSQGFAVTWHKQNGDFFYQLIRIKPGIPKEVLFNDKIYVR